MLSSLCSPIGLKKPTPLSKQLDAIMNQSQISHQCFLCGWDRFTVFTQILMFNFNSLSYEWPRQHFSLQYQYNIKQTSDENKEKYQSGDYKLIQYIILQTYITRTVWQTVRRITSEILGVKGLIWLIFVVLFLVL